MSHRGVFSHPSAGNSANVGISTVPVLTGWGGIRLDEAAAGGGVNHPASPTPSAVFAGESATNMELALVKMKAMGSNTIRVDFDPYCTPSQYMSTYNPANLQRAIQIAQYYGLWMVVDYHGYSEAFNSTQESCWLNFWSGVTSQFKSSYNQIIWEPLNEPCYASICAGNSTTNNMCSGASSCVPTLSLDYQAWINQARGQGDTHWIVVQNICSYGCTLSDWATGFPTVADPLGTLAQGGRIFISLHSYMGYSPGTWNNATAESLALRYYQAVVSGMKTTGWPALNTEGGPDPLCTSCAPDAVLTGSAGYTNTTFHFIQTLTNLYDSNSPQRINWIWWPAGSWTDTPGSGIYGALQCDNKPAGWGCILTTSPIVAISPPVIAPALTTGFSTNSTSLVVGQTVAFTAQVNGGVSPYDFSWDFGDGSTGSGGIVSHSYNAAGIFMVALTTTDDGSPRQNVNFTSTVTVSAKALKISGPSYMMTWLGYDWDGGREQTLTLNGQLLAVLPSVNIPQNIQVNTPFALNITPLLIPGVNTLMITHADWDCSVIDRVSNLQIVRTIGNQSLLVYSSQAVLPLGCGQPVTVEFTTPRPTYNLTWIGFDWDGSHEETLTLNGHLLASLPSAGSPQNSQNFAAFSLDITSFVVPGPNVLVITHANWDCAVRDIVQGLQVNLHFGNSTTIVNSRPAPEPLGCGQPLTYTFTVQVF